MTSDIDSDQPIGQRDFVHSLSRGLSLVGAFDEDHSAMTLDEVAARSGFSRSATRRLLRTLATRGYIAFDGRRFSLTPRLLNLGYAQQSQLSLADVARPHAEGLARRLDRNVSVAVLDGPDVVFLLRVGARRIMSVSLSVGSRLPAHLTAIGRALVAWLPDDQIEEYLEAADFRSHTAKTIRSASDLRADLLRVRADGWSLVDQELEAGLSAIAVPVRDRRAGVVAAINVSFQTSGATQLNSERTHALPGLLQTAAQIGVDLHPTHLP